MPSSSQSHLQPSFFSRRHVRHRSTQVAISDDSLVVDVNGETKELAFKEICDVRRRLVGGKVVSIGLRLDGGETESFEGLGNMDDLFKKIVSASRVVPGGYSASDYL